MTATETKERPILFKGRLVRAILDGTKTQTRRVVKFRVEHGSGTPSTHYRKSARTERAHDLPGEPFGASFRSERGGDVFVRCPYGQPGDRLWVRETFIDGWPSDCGDIMSHDEHGRELPKHVWYRADDEWISDRGARIHGWTTQDGAFTDRIPWKPSIHMPRWASRITLEVTDVRVERIQGISGEDVMAEGIVWDADSPMVGPCEADAGDLIEQFALTWDEINGPRGYGWAANPWVWVVSFRRIDGGDS